MQTTQSLAGLTPTHTQALHLLLARLALTGRWRALSSAPRAAMAQPVTLDDHSEVDPRLPIPNRIVKRLCADDSGRTSVKVGHRQALTPKTPGAQHAIGGFFIARMFDERLLLAQMINKKTCRSRQQV